MYGNTNAVDCLTMSSFQLLYFIIISLSWLGPAVELTSAAVIPILPAQRPEARLSPSTAPTGNHHNNNNNDLDLGQRAISAVMGESAVVDKETGRIYWEGGSSNTLVESIAPKVRSVIGIPHVKATLLSILLLLAVGGTVSQLVRDWLPSMRAMADLNTDGRHRATAIPATFVLMALHALLILPKVPRWFLIIVVTLYFIEAYTCSTHKYLLHIVDDAESYIEQLRDQLPIVEWKVRSFHFENYVAVPFQLVRERLQQLLQLLSLSSVESSNNAVIPDTHQPSFPSLLHWKRVTHSATGYYNYTSCTDQTMVGVWKRAPIIMRYNPTSPTTAESHVSNSTTNNTTTTSSPPITPNTAIIPITKMVITKTLLLRDAKTRQDYFSQQKAFLRQEHPDEYAEFSTNVYMNGFVNSSRILALLPSKSLLLHSSNSTSHKTLSHPQRWLVHRYTYWFFTCIGLTVPYRRWLASQCDEVRVRIVKETGMD
jgi:hypothetical protein